MARRKENDRTIEEKKIRKHTPDTQQGLIRFNCTLFGRGFGCILKTKGREADLRPSKQASKHTIGVFPHNISEFAYVYPPEHA